jgi:hypothetical protein
MHIALVSDFGGGAPRCTTAFSAKLLEPGAARQHALMAAAHLLGFSGNVDDMGGLLELLDGDSCMSDTDRHVCISERVT